MSESDNKQARQRWQQGFAQQVAGDDPIRNRSGIEIKPLYTPEDTHSERYLEDLTYPGQYPFTRGVYHSMYRGRAWSQRQLVGLSSPEAFNQRQRALLEVGSSGVSLIPCNSGFRGLDMDQVDPLLLGTCGTLVNTSDDMAICLDGIPLDQVSIGLNDPLPFTFAAFTLSEAQRQGIAWDQVSGTSNQSDYISHYVANHMFFRLALPGSRRVLIDHIEFMLKHAPRWNPLSIVGQHMQQAGATPAEAMGLTLSTALQYAEDCLSRGMQADDFLPRFSFFFDISVSFFEEVAKFRAGRRIWARLTRERFGARSDRANRLRFHAQTSGADLTRQQPLNNLSRVTVQAMAGILGGLQSLHTDAYDEALGSPTEKAARLAINTQNILREEAGLTEVIDPLGGSYYVESLTDEMETTIMDIINRIDDAGGMYKAVEAGLVQSIIGESALNRQQQIDCGEQAVVGVNCHQVEEPATDRASLERPDPAEIDRCLERLRQFKEQRSQSDVRRALTELARVADSDNGNVFEAVVAAATARSTHGEIVATLREVYGFGQPRVGL